MAENGNLQKLLYQTCTSINRDFKLPKLTITRRNSVSGHVATVIFCSHQIKKKRYWQNKNQKADSNKK